MIERISAGDVELTTIDYSSEDGPFYYVWVDDSPVLPEMPLPWEEACRKAELEREEDPDAAVEVRECTEEDLKWAGLR